MTIHVVGNCTMDVIFAVDRFPAPGETLIARDRRVELGGKGVNQAVVARRFGAEVRLIAPLGADADGDAAAAALRGEGIDPGALSRVSVATDQSIIYVAPGGENTIVSTAAAAESLTPEAAEAALARLGPRDWVMAQGNLTFEATLAALKAARARGARTFLNPAPVRWGADKLWGLCDVAVLNRVEAEALTGCADPLDAVRTLRRAGVGLAVITLGPEGALWAGPDGGGACPAAPTRAIDAAGAGDSFCGALIAALVSGRSAAPALLVGARAAAVTVSRRGTHASFPTSAEAAAILKAVP
jgi:ribokinase